MALSKTTRDHDEIRRWAEARGAKPAAVASTESKNQTGILRLEFPGKPNAKDSALEEISWDEFFEKFDAMGLEMVYQDKTADGEQSNFNKLVYPENDKSHRKSTAKSHSRSTASRSKTSKSKSSSTGTRSASSRTAKSSSSKSGSGRASRSSGTKTASRSRSK